MYPNPRPLVETNRAHAQVHSAHKMHHANSLCCAEAWRLMRNFQHSLNGKWTGRAMHSAITKTADFGIRPLNQPM